jgi:ABC-type sugar transport system permease subunit
MSASTAPSHGPAAVVSSVHAWWQALPLAAVFAVFFLVPLGLVLMVSFWDFNEYEFRADKERELREPGVYDVGFVGGCVMMSPDHGSGFLSFVQGRQTGHCAAGAASCP